MKDVCCVCVCVNIKYTLAIFKCDGCWWWWWWTLPANGPDNTMSVEYTASIVQDGAGKKTNVSEIERESQRIFVQNWSIINILSPAKLTKLMKLLNLLNKFAIFLVIFVQKFHFFGRLNDHANHLCNGWRTMLFAM